MKDQKDCAECASIKPGKPRCGYCLGDLIGEQHEEVIGLRAQLAEARDVIEFYASQKHLEKLIPGVNYDMQRADWRVSHPYVGGVEYGQTAAAFLAKYPKGD